MIRYPRRHRGRRVAASVLMLLGIGLFSAINATLTSFMLANESEAPASAADRLRELADRYRSGLLTDDEYESKRSDAIARL